MQLFIDLDNSYTMEELKNIREKWVDYVEANDED